MLIAQSALADNYVNGFSSRQNVICTQSTAWLLISRLFMPSSSHSHRCVITASADLIHPNGNVSERQYYYIGVSLDDPNPDLNVSTARTVELRNVSGQNDPDYWPVSTNQTVTTSANTNHAFYFFCRKNLSNSPDLTIDDYSFSVICVP